MTLAHILALFFFAVVGLLALVSIVRDVRAAWRDFLDHDREAEW